jgi:hypothetical protein
MKQASEFYSQKNQTLSCLVFSIATEFFPTSCFGKSHNRKLNQAKLVLLGNTAFLLPKNLKNKLQDFAHKKNLMISQEVLLVDNSFEISNISLLQEI